MDISNKITRDLAYPIGGGLIICSLWLAFIADGNIERAMNTLSSIPTILSFVFIGFAYVVGFVCQEIFSLIPGFSTTLKIDGWWCCFRSTMNCLYKRYTKEEFTNITGFTDFASSDIMEISGFDNLKDKINRAATLKHIGTCIGPCSIVSGIILLFVPSFTVRISGFIVISLGIILCIVGRLKTMQEICYFAYLDTKKDTDK